MASAGGPRAEGGDGYDFEHRQKVALHYRESLTYKARLNSIFVVHGMLALLIAIKLFDDIFHYHIGLNLGWLRALDMPEATFWEYWWLTSLASIFLAKKALPRNNAQELTISYYIMFVCGVVPIAIGVGALLPELLDYVFNGPDEEMLEARAARLLAKEENSLEEDDDDEDAIHLFMGRVPMCVIWHIWFFIALQVHAFAMYFALHLVRLWRRLSPQEQILLKKKDE